MTNKDIINKMAEVYDPKTAFGNPELISLKKKLIEPDKDGVYTIQAEVQEIVDYELRWQCQKCGHRNREDHYDDDSIEEIERSCFGCETLHKLKL